MISVLFVADSLMAGGIESQLVHLASGLDRAEFAPHVLSLYGPTVRDLHFAPQLREANVPLSLSDLRLRARDKAHGVGIIVALAWKLRPTIIQAEGYHANLLMRLAAPFLPRTRLIGSLRGVHSGKQMLYERLSHHLCTCIVVNAPHLKASLIRDGHLPPGKVVHIPNGIAVERFATPHDAQLRAILGPHIRRLFVSLGRVSLEKNVHWTVEALGLLKQQNRLPAGVLLLIAGPQHGVEAQRLLEQATHAFGLEDTVIQHPATHHPEDYYHAGDACVLYSPNEGLSNVCLEALAAGRPLVVSAAANAAGPIEHGVTGWVVPDRNIPRLADTLHEISELPQARLDAMRAACLQRAAQFSVDAMVAAYELLYRRLAGSAAEHVHAMASGSSLRGGADAPA
jgi:L-malate glycosyltransferase